MNHEPSRRILITGGSSGIGFEASKQLIQRGHELILLCRTEERCKETIKVLSAMKKEQTTVKGIAINLKCLEAIETGCRRLLQTNKSIDTLILNAGIQNVGIKKPQFTKQGIEETFCINHLSHQLIQTEKDHIKSKNTCSNDIFCKNTCKTTGNKVQLNH